MIFFVLLCDGLYFGWVGQGYSTNCHNKADLCQLPASLLPVLLQKCPPMCGTEDFKLWDPLYYVRTGVEAIVDDEVTKRFTAEELTVSQ